MVNAINQVKGLFNLRNVTDHRQHDLKVIETFAGLQHRPDLHQENFRMIKCDTYAAPPQERIFFTDGEITQRFIAANIQRAHGDRTGRESLKLLAVVLPLLLLGRKALLDHKGHFRAIKPDPLRTVIQGPHNIRHQPGVHQQRYPVAIGGFAWQVP